MRLSLPGLAAFVAFGVACRPDDDATTDTGGDPGPTCSGEVDTICAWAGSGAAGFNGDAVPALEAMMYFPMDVAISPYGRPVVADWNNHKLRMLEDDGRFVTIMGTDFVGDGDPLFLDSTVQGAPGTDVSLNHPTQQRWLPDGRLLSASWHTHKLRTWDPATKLVHVLAGASPDYVGDNYADLGTARFNQPVAVEFDDAGNLYVVDMRNERVRMITPDRKIVTIAGSGDQGYCGDGGPARQACLGFPRSENPEPGGALAFSPDQTRLYVADTENHVIRVLDMQTAIIDLYAGVPETAGDVDGDRSTARFHYPRDLVMSPEGILFVADSDNHKIRAIDTNTGEVSTFVGTGAQPCPGDGPPYQPRTCDEQLAGRAGDDGHRLEASLYRPFGVELDLDGNLVFADTFSHRFRIVFR